jgi:hypothetical protein
MPAAPRPRGRRAAKKNLHSDKRTPVVSIVVTFSVA